MTYDKIKKGQTIIATNSIGALTLLSFISRRNGVDKMYQAEQAKKEEIEAMKNKYTKLLLVLLQSFK
uniref:hypothetical protein n=1 Tax=Enterococcus faecalis TaxID=1351 RepID=UPI0024796537|nr:hypothetical protein [Enterococcus faecalis]